MAAPDSTPPLAGPDPPPLVPGLWRWLYVALGMFFVGLAILGALLPVLPTTPFLLLASFFFVRSSPRLHAWLLRTRFFGGLLRDWHHHRGVRRPVKVTALTVIPVVVFSSAYFGSLDWPWVILLILLALIGMTVVIRLPVIGNHTSEPRP